MDKQELKIESVSKTALNVFDRCERKFWLRYGEDLNWPGAASQLTASREEQMRKGKLFHDLIEQEAAGVEVQDFIKDSGEEEIKEWWKNYKEFAPVIGDDDLVFTETQLQMIVDEVLVLARYDRIIIRPDGSALIVDWKTVDHPEQNMGRLRLDWQTVIYPIVLKKCFSALPGMSGLELSNVAFMYWYAGSPEDPVLFELSDQDILAYEEKLGSALDQIVPRLKRNDYSKTAILKRCEDCPYAVLCDRLDVPEDGDAEMTEAEFLEDFELFDWSDLSGDDILPLDI